MDTCAQLHVRTCARAVVPRFPYLGNGLTDCAEIWFLVRDQLAWRFTKVNGGVRVHVRNPFSYLGNDWTDCAETQCVIRGPLAVRVTQNGDIRTSARVTVHTFKPICSLPRVHRPKGALLISRFRSVKVRLG